MARQSGCPTSIKDSVVEILDKASGKYIRIRGMDTMNFELSADTEEGSGGDALWKEPYVSKRGGKLSLKGKPISDPATGVRDDGQDRLIDAAVSEGGCENDQTIRIADTVGHTNELDVIVTGYKQDTEESGETISYDMELVGEPRFMPYVQVTGVTAKDKDDAELSETDALEVAVNDSEVAIVAITPEVASNKKFSASSSDKKIARIASIEDDTLHIVGVSEGDCIINIKTMNGGKTTKFKVNVT